MFTRTRWFALPLHAARALWWVGVPVVVLGLLVVVDRTFLPPFIALGEAVGSMRPTSPLATELIALYPFTLAATALAVALVGWSHHRRTRAVRPQSLLLPTYVAALEACNSAYWAPSCGGGLAAPTLAEAHALLHQAAAASLVAMAAPLVIAAILMRVARNGVSGTMTKTHWLAACAATTSVMLIWLMYDVVFFRSFFWTAR